MARRSRLTALSLLPLGCSADDEGAAAAADEIRRARDLPWEVSSPEGESVVPNVFHAEASENEQIAPTTIDGKHVIDRLIYPTLGNPNLFVRSESDESFLTVMRLEKELLAHLAPRLEALKDGAIARAPNGAPERLVGGLSRRPGCDAPQLNHVTLFVNAETDASNPLRGVFDNLGE